MGEYVPWADNEEVMSVVVVVNLHRQCVTDDCGLPSGQPTAQPPSSVVSQPDTLSLDLLTHLRSVESQD